MKLTKKLNIYLSHFAHALWFAGLPVRLFFIYWPLLSKISDSPMTMKRCLQATFPSLSTGHLPKLVHRLTTKACPRANHQGSSMFIHQCLSTGYLSELVHRPPSKACPQATSQGLPGGYVFKIVYRSSSKACPKRPPSKVCLLQATYQGLSTGHSPTIAQRLHTRDCPQVT